MAPGFGGTKPEAFQALRELRWDLGLLAGEEFRTSSGFGEHRLLPRSAQLPAGFPCMHVGTPLSDQEECLQVDCIIKRGLIMLEL